jgi:hypothetical protein
MDKREVSYPWTVFLYMYSCNAKLKILLSANKALERVMMATVSSHIFLALRKTYNS